MRFLLALLLLSPLALSAQVAPATFVERQIHFPTDGLQAPGTLTLPANPSGKLPLVILVQGSGVQDRDETISPNKPFVDLAHGLAAQGIATLRYDRRPMFALGTFLANEDLDHEVVIDAVSALAYGATLTAIDPHRIYLLGHSLGAQLAPDIVKARLAQKPDSVRGMILLSGVARPIDVVMLEQLRTLGKAQGGTPEQIDQFIQAWSAVFAAAKNPATPVDTPLGVGTQVPAGYWRDWLARDPVATMKTLNVPALVLRGTKDSNTTEVDFQMLTKAATAPGSASKEFSGLNHIYMPIQGVSDGRDELTPGHVAQPVIDTIANWIAGKSI